LQLLADEMVRLTVHERISGETIRRRLGEMDLKPWQQKTPCARVVVAPVDRRNLGGEKAR
jgi:hypothetical protein